MGFAAAENAQAGRVEYIRQPSVISQAMLRHRHSIAAAEQSSFNRSVARCAVLC